MDRVEIIDWRQKAAIYDKIHAAASVEDLKVILLESLELLASTEIFARSSEEEQE